jgi:beta-glucosidase
MKKRKNAGMVLCVAGIAAIVAVTAIVNPLGFGKYDNILEQFFGKTADSIQGDLKGADAAYVKSDFSSSAELYRYEEDLCADIAAEGVTLLKNDGLLPLQKNTTLSLFSHSSVDLVSGGSGSGSGSFELTADLKTGLEAAGLKVNDKLWNFYQNGKGSAYTRGTGVINYGQSLDWSINECPLREITSSAEVTSSYGDSVAVFVLSRTGGEGGDEARDMAAYGGKAGQHYLEIDDTEREIISYLNDTFESVLLLVNCNNAMELGWTQDYPHIKAVVNFPGAGRTGTYGLGRILVGEDEDGKEISPSGHLVDTFVYDDFSSPAAQNMGDFRFSDTDYYYVNYAEGIYVGYRYYETRYEDRVYDRENVGEYDYANTVVYPFGFGLSYTEFEWSEFALSGADENGDMTVTVRVKNVGERAGADVVQVYVQSPYTAYDRANGVEKSAVSLVGFAKTALLAAGEEEKVVLTVHQSDFISYDAKRVGGYILEGGDYYLTAAKDAHAAVNNIIQAKGGALSDRLVPSPSEEVAGDRRLVAVFAQGETDTQTYSSYDNENGTGKVGNLFDDCTLADAKYLSRQNWAQLDNDGLRYGVASGVDSGAEVGGKQWTHTVDGAVKARLDSRDSLNPAEGQDTTEYTFGAKNGVELIDLRGKSFSDPLWEQLLDEITLPELTKLIEECGYCSPAVDSIHKAKVTDLDGPAGLNKVVGHGSADIGDGFLAMTWPSEYMLACTWNKDLAERMGDGVGEDGLYSGVVGWYGPAMNIHRTPFGGRNFEYYSEDGFLSGVFGKAETIGAAKKGVYAFIKHFALNDQETHRDQLGLVTWASEQTIREIYLKPFELCVKDYEVTVAYNEPIQENGEIVGYERKTAKMPATFGVMSSFNRIGATWAGGNYNLLTGVLRREWGYNGFVLTDYEVYSYMNTNQALAAGGDGKLKTVDMSNLFGSSYDLAKNVAYQGYAREAAHHILFTVVNSAAMNGYVHGCVFVSGFAYYKFFLIGWNVLAAVGVAGLTFYLVKKIRSRKIKEPKAKRE